MYKRKKYIIDKKFQLKTAFGFIGITTLLAVIILAAISATIIYNNNRIDKIIKVEDNIFQTFVVISMDKSKSATKVETIGKMSQDHFNNYKETGRIINFNEILLISLLVFFILQGVFLYILIIRKTHRISGPIYVISNYFREILQGKYPEPRPLRKKDDLKDFYNLFIQVVAFLKKSKKTK
jgi:hypothetical protein